MFPTVFQDEMTLRKKWWNDLWITAWKHRLTELVQKASDDRSDQRRGEEQQRAHQRAMDVYEGLTETALKFLAITVESLELLLSRR